MTDKKRRIMFSSMMGNIVEYYDFGIYAVFAAMIGKLFFHVDDPATQLLLTFSVFSIGFMMRPLGGVVFGYIGDKFGRKKALIISMLGMSFSTLGIGLLPTYAEVGFWATAALVIIRMIQGVCIGGEGAGSAIFIMEHMEKSRVGTMGGFIMASNIMGTLLANLVALGIEVTVGIDENTWRHCFFLGAILGVIGLYFRLKNKETPAFEKFKENIKNEKRKAPVIDVIQRKKYALLSVFSIAASATSIAYLVRGYLEIFLSSQLHYTNQESLKYTIFTLSALVILLPIVGMLTNRFSTTKILSAGAILVFLLIIPMWHLVATNGNFIYVGLFGIAVVGAMMGAPAYPHAINSFPPEIRYSGIALGWNLGNAVFGGTTPLICTVLVKYLGIYGPCYYLMFTSVMFAILRFFASIYLKKIGGKL